MTDEASGAPDQRAAPTDAREFAVSAVAEYGPQLHQFLRRRIYRRQDLDDLVQEVYLRLLRVKNVEAIRNPLAYLYGVAAHVASEFNMRGSKGCVVFDSPTTDVALSTRDEAAGGRTVEGGGYFERRVSDALEQLSDMRLAVLLLERRDGLTHAQIAEKLDLSVHTVKKYAVQALAHVRANLD